ncbi:16S rRNA (uracil(1498)-N(3))-methyltransferase [Arenibacter sp. TNZ]|jgi:16S rRNA (uracil1498-N3)-methyltransferase|uniref:16S rRNA (uracil(1498)-N(3))-methyltransferase n=1 Tax=Arenibacter TaxID=178469 RepID=UPI000CD445EA|nr:MULTISPECIES: 16S rRNA (uracil(1498)-N(3))-methyltransferase [Arenibacter]MCM4170281.1 16S rRNA (uracil(1498)-N(3))-methyltransferase [Arenibacter sp. TNZ]
MQLFYHPELENNTDQFIFPTDESRHISKVLRKKSGDILQITNGKGIWFEAEILSPDHKKCVAKIISKTQIPPKPYQLHMAVAPTKLNDRFEWFLEKATEIGVHEITPVICDHSERKVIKMDRMEKVIQSAMKQSLQVFLPQLNPTITFKEFMTQSRSGEIYIAHCEEDKKKELSQSALAHKNTTILIGPEGDFSPEEIKLALENKFQAVALGNTRLRTETAAIVACTTIALINLQKTP